MTRAVVTACLLALAMTAATAGVAQARTFELDQAEAPALQPTPEPAPDAQPEPTPPVTVPAPVEKIDAVTVNDPWQDMNRATYRFNAGLDHYVFAPVVHTYMRAPGPVRRGVSNVLVNLREPRTALNDLAQGHVKRAGSSAGRFAINSTVGVLGLFDVAAHAGLTAHHSDFGQTLGRYGVRPGPYLMLPVLGPHTARDAFGRLVDSLTDPVGLVAGGISTTFGATRTVVNGVNYRAEADPAVRALDDAIDPYAAMRAAYLQRRAFLVRQATGEEETLPDFDEAK